MSRNPNLAYFLGLDQLAWGMILIVFGAMVVGLLIGYASS